MQEEKLPEQYFLLPQYSLMSCLLSIFHCNNLFGEQASELLLKWFININNSFITCCSTGIRQVVKNTFNNPEHLTLAMLVTTVKY